MARGPPFKRVSNPGRDLRFSDTASPLSWASLPGTATSCPELQRNSVIHPILQMRKQDQTGEATCPRLSNCHLSDRGQAKAPVQMVWQEKGNGKGTGGHRRGGRSAYSSPCARQGVPGPGPPAPTPHPPLLLTLGGPLAFLHVLHLGKHLLSRAPHRGQVGMDVDLSVLLGALVQAGERRWLAWAEGRPSPRALHLHPGARCPDLPWLQQAAPLPGPGCPNISTAPRHSHLWPTCGRWQILHHPAAVPISIGDNR